MEIVSFQFHIHAIVLWLPYIGSGITWVISIVQGRIQGGSWGAGDPPFSLKMMANFRKIEPFSLAKLQLFQTFSSYCSIKHTKLTSKVPNLVEIEHFTVKKQLIALRSQQLGGVVKQFVGVTKILHARIVL